MSPFDLLLMRFARFIHWCKTESLRVWVFSLSLFFFLCLFVCLSLPPSPPPTLFSCYIVQVACHFHPWLPFCRAMWTSEVLKWNACIHVHIRPYPFGWTQWTILQPDAAAIVVIVVHFVQTMWHVRVVAMHMLFLWAPCSHTRLERANMVVKLQQQWIQILNLLYLGSVVSHIQSSVDIQLQWMLTATNTNVIISTQNFISSFKECRNFEMAFVNCRMIYAS